MKSSTSADDCKPLHLDHLLRRQVCPFAAARRDSTVGNALRDRCFERGRFGCPLTAAIGSGDPAVGVRKITALLGG